MKEPKLLLGRAKISFGLVCVASTTLLSLTETFRYLQNSDISSITNRRFNEQYHDQYPTFSICFKGQDIYWRNEHLLFDKLELSSSQYADTLKGRGWRYKYDETKEIYYKEHVTFDNVSNIDLNTVTLRDSDVIVGAQFITKTKEQEYHYVKNNNEKNTSRVPFHIGYQTPDEICFTRNSKYERDLIRLYDKISLNQNLLEPGNNHNVEIRIIVHYPGQLIRDFDNPSFRSFLGSYQGNKMLEMKISSVTKLTRRNDSNIRCNPDINNDDDRQFQRQIIDKHVGCIPNYWSYAVRLGQINNTCESLDDLRNTIRLINNFKQVLTYDPPCVEMKSLVTYANEVDQLPHQFYVKIIYTESFYQEIRNDRAFSFVSLFSTAGGYLGLFLGYSLLQIPELLKDAFTFLRDFKLTSTIGRLRIILSLHLLDYV